MTIKKRLSISNILMIVIPILVLIVLASVGFTLFNAIMGGALVDMVKAERETQTVQRANFNAQMVIGSFIALTGIVTVMYLTNRFLIKFVFMKIEQPLEMLSDGVHQISDGNLDYRIIYHGEDEFKPICEDFNNMAIQLKSSVEEVQRNEQNRKELIAGISHDLRSPLTSIKAFVEGLLDGVAATPETQREYLQTIRQKTDDINNMVSQLFLYSKMDMGSYPTHPEVLDIGKEISDFVIAAGDDFVSKGLTVETGDMPAEKYVYADPLQLRSVFTNILGNSAKYKEKDTANASVFCTVKDGVIRIVFEDDGPGVPKSALPKLFDVFYRNEPSRNNPQQGSGLGLAITSKALERMNGRVRAENRNQGGLRLIIEIPEAKGDRPV